MHTFAIFFDLELKSKLLILLLIINEDIINA